MRQKAVSEKESAEQVVKNIRRATRRHFSAEDKVRSVLEGLRGEDSIAELAARKGSIRTVLPLVERVLGGRQAATSQEGEVLRHWRLAVPFSAHRN
jgi:transposase